MDYRNITVDDVPAVTSYALHALRTVAVDEPLHIAPLKVRDAVRFFAKDTSGHHFNLVAFDDTVCVGAIAAFSAEMQFFERQEAYVMFCYAEPGIGMKMVREMMGWARAEPRIRRIVWPLNNGPMGSRMNRVFTRRMAFKPVDMLVWTKE